MSDEYMFYDEKPDPSFRFGDIVCGFPLGSADIKCPATDHRCSDHTIKIEWPQYSVVLTPCCSIGQKKIILTPLLEIKHMVKCLENPYFSADLTNINRVMNPKQMFTSDMWAKMSEEQKRHRFDTQKKQDYTFLEHFIYAPDDRLDEYEIRKPKDRNTEITGYYSVDFRKACLVYCAAITRDSQDAANAKILQLSKKTREELRSKLTYFYGRIPDEDRL
jgi:hypothetical protein